MKRFSRVELADTFEDEKFVIKKRHSWWKPHPNAVPQFKQLGKSILYTLLGFVLFVASFFITGTIVQQYCAQYGMVAHYRGHGKFFGCERQPSIRSRR